MKKLKSIKWKKILTLMLVALLCVAALPVTVAASDATDNAGAPQVTSVTSDEGLTVITDGDTDADADTQTDGSGTDTENVDNADSESGESTDSDTGSGDNSDSATESGSNTDSGTESGDNSGSGSQPSDSNSTDSSGDMTDTGSANGTGVASDDSSSTESDTTDSTDSSDTNTESSTSTNETVPEDDEETVTDADAAAAVEALIDALPTVEELKAMTSSENLTAANDQSNEAYEAYEALSDDGKALVSEESLTKLYEVLDYFNGQISTLEETSENKTLTVGSNQTYTTIQRAVNAIYTDDDPTDWTIEVESGDYAPFAVPTGVDGLTVEAATGASVTIHTWNDSYVNSEYTVNTVSGEYLKGVYVYAEDVTIEGIDFEIGPTDSTVWYKTGIWGRSTATGLAVNGCSFSVDDTIETQTQGVISCASTCAVTDCEFEGLVFAVYLLGDDKCADGVSITYSTFTDCENACVIYYGGGPIKNDEDGTVTFCYNTVIGSADQYSSVAIEDLNNLDSITTVVIESNTFVYSVVGLVAVGSDAYDSLSENNDCDEYSIGIYTAISSLGATNVEFKFLSPSEDEGYWVFDEIVFDSSNSIYQDADAAKEAIKAAIVAANESGSKTLTVTLNMTGYPKQLIENNCIYWASGSLPELSKYISVTVTDENGNGTEEKVKQADMAAGDSVNYVLTYYVPSTLDRYIDYSDSEDTGSSSIGTVKTYKVTDENGDEVTATYSYTLTFHDQMDSALSYNGDVKVTLVTYELDDDGNVTSTVKDTIDVTSYATVTTSGLEDGCTFEVSIDLLALYDDGKIVEADFGSAEIIVTYSATLSKDATPGSYINTAYVTCPEGQSEEDTAQVDTYGLRIYKYDISTFNKKNSDSALGNTIPLAGAVFYLCDENHERVSGALITGDDGLVEFTTKGLSGTYYLVEFAAPTGYVAEEEIEITISCDEIDEEDSYIVTVEVANAAIPQTGGMGTQPFTLAGVVILLAAGLVYVVTRRRVY